MKVIPLFPSNPPLKVEVLSSPPPFLKIWLEAQPPPPLQKGGGFAHYMGVCKCDRMQFIDRPN